MTIPRTLLLALTLLMLPLPDGKPAHAEHPVRSCTDQVQQGEAVDGDTCQMDLGVRGTGAFEWSAGEYRGVDALELPGDGLLVECIRIGGRGLNPLTGALLLFGLLILPGTVSAVVLAVVISFASEGLD